MTRISLFLLFFLSTMCLVSSAYGSNPFLTKEKGTERKGQQEEIQQKPVQTGRGYPAFLQPLLSFSNAMQKTIKTKLSGFAREMQENPYGGAFWLFLLFTFLYGVFHALGPGHGKTFACSYFLSRPGSYVQGVMLGNLSSFLHAMLSATVVMVGYFILKISGIEAVDQSGAGFEMISYGILFVLGLFLAGKAIYELTTGKVIHRHDCTSHGPKADFKSLALVSLASGLIPCPGAAIILIFSISLGILVQGLIAMLAIALGMGVTATAFAFMAISAQKSVFRVFENHEKLFITGYALLTLGGSLIITITGGLLFFSRI